MSLSSMLLLLNLLSVLLGVLLQIACLLGPKPLLFLDRLKDILQF